MAVANRRRSQMDPFKIIHLAINPVIHKIFLQLLSISFAKRYQTFRIRTVRNIFFDPAMTFYNEKIKEENLTGWEPQPYWENWHQERDDDAFFYVNYSPSKKCVTGLISFDLYHDEKIIFISYLINENDLRSLKSLTNKVAEAMNKHKYDIVYEIEQEGGDQHNRIKFRLLSINFDTYIAFPWDRHEGGDFDDREPIPDQFKFPDPESPFKPTVHEKRYPLGIIPSGKIPPDKERVKEILRCVICKAYGNSPPLEGRKKEEYNDYVYRIFFENAARLETGLAIKKIVGRIGNRH
ncbi:MAG: hypothetical protein HQL51_08415 [Magnetococcales bacterium]|nr:hypothetical protein [Magnetococcales bacterium]